MAAPTKGNTTNINPTPGANFYQFTHNQNTGSNGLVIVQLTMSNSVTPSTATYGGQSMTRLYTINRGGLSQRMAFYYLQNPPTGNNTLRINFSGSQWNPISLHARSFTNSGGIGASLRSGGSSTPKNQNLTVQQDDSLVMITSTGVNQILTQQIPTGSNKSFTTHNTNRQVATGAISANSGESAGVINLRATATFGNLTMDRTEIKGLNSPPPSDSSGGDFFVFM
tara:strand:+ start:569 stop:1243 length:675 start_codon:yes stop_codon:yes gene_type:complete